MPVPLVQGGNFVHWRAKIETTAEVVEASADGWPALIRSGGLHYLAVWPDEAALTRIVQSLCDRKGVETDPLPEGLRRRDSATYRFWFN